MSMLGYSSEDIVIKNSTYKEVHKCNACKYFTNFIFLIRNHVRRHRLSRRTFNCMESAPEIFHCKDCNFKTDLTMVFKKHIKQIHFTNTENESESQILEYTLRSFICRTCTFGTYSSLQWLKHQVGCPLSEETNGSKISFKIKKNKIIKWQCRLCPYKSKFRSHLKQHVRNRHTEFQDEDLFHCDQCSFKTKTKDRLKKHKLVHLASNEVPWFQCDKCPFKTKWKFIVKNHNLNKHLASEEIQWLECDQCSFKTKTKACLKKHKLVHLASNEVQWVQCDKCPFKTKFKYVLKNHNINKHVASEDIQWAQCDKCSYKTKMRKDLTVHKNHKHKGN